MPKVGFDSSNPKNQRCFHERLRGETLLFLQGDLNSRTLLEGRGKDLLSEARWEDEIKRWQKKSVSNNKPSPKFTVNRWYKHVRTMKIWVVHYCFSMF